MDLETIPGIPHSALKIYIDVSMIGVGISESGLHIETPNDVTDIMIRNTNYCSVFKSELSAIYKRLQFIDTASEPVFRGISMRTEKLPSIQHLSNWTTVGGKKSLNILDLVVRLSFRHSIYFQ
ncbi:uncharacterized protein TNCV_5136331 [Trichonephila clavipes]|nr:uncharacterized protein TNCV_5136331 [Trichonephila clavipes]